TPGLLPAGPASLATASLSLHDALPISAAALRRRAARRDPAARSHPRVRTRSRRPRGARARARALARRPPPRHALPPQRPVDRGRSEEHTSELQSRVDLVCRLLLEKKKI